MAKKNNEDTLTSALAELAKSGIAFTSELGDDRKRTYIVDTVRLTEDEILRLYRKGALNPAGIRHYLVDRAA